MARIKYQEAAGLEVKREMGPFGRNIHNSGNVRNVPVYDLTPCPVNVYLGAMSMDADLETVVNVNYLGKKRSV